MRPSLGLSRSAEQMACSVSPHCARRFTLRPSRLRARPVVFATLLKPSRRGSSDNRDKEPEPEVYLKPLVVQEGLVDDPNIRNPLQRLERLGTGWLGVIFDFEGVLVEDMARDHAKAWTTLAQKEGLRPALAWQANRIAGMKAEQAISEVLCWTRNPTEVRRLAQRKHEIFREITQARVPSELPGARRLLDTLRAQGTPMAVATTATRARVTEALQKHGMSEYFAALICAEDASRGRPDPEALLLASMDIQRPAMRCVVMGNSNQAIEAAHEIGMKCAAVASSVPVFELTAADLVVRQLDAISYVNLKSLFRYEPGRDVEPELQPEEEEKNGPSVQTMVMD